MADMLEGKIGEREGDLCHAICALTFSDILQNLCFKRGHWSPQGAHRLLKKIKSGEWNLLSPKILTIFVRICFDMISDLPAIFAESPKLASAGGNSEPPNESDSEFSPSSMVRLSELRPGMRLAEPLRSYDGKTVLERNLLLDEDIIWRLIQLSAIRPLASPVWIKAEEQAAEALG
jgi:hypothetical protein